jgi:hypothetical protein
MAKLLSIQLLIDRKNRTPEFASNLSFNLRVEIDKLMRGLIRVEKFSGRKDLAQALAKAALACGNSAGDPDRRHDSETEAFISSIEKLSRRAKPTEGGANVCRCAAKSPTISAWMS